MAVYRPNIDTLVSLGNFTQAFRWKVDFTKMPSAPTMAPFASQSESSNLINFRAESMTLPEVSVETTEITIRGHKIHQPGVATYNSPLTLTLMETVDHKVLDFIGAWQTAHWEALNSRGRTQSKGELFAEMRLWLLDSEDDPYYVFFLHNCFLENVTKGDADASTAEPFKPALSIVYDYFNKHSVAKSINGGASAPKGEQWLFTDTVTQGNPS